MVVLWWRGVAAGDPVEDVGIGTVEQRLIAVELTIVERRKMRVGKAAEDQVTFSRPAVPGTERQPLAADLR